MEDNFSWREIFREISARSKELLMADVLKPSREYRRRRACARRGVPFALGVEAHRTLQGILGLGKKAHFAIDGHDIIIDSNTFVLGELVAGSLVGAVVEEKGGELRARKVLVYGDK